MRVRFLTQLRVEKLAGDYWRTLAPFVAHVTGIPARILGPIDNDYVTVPEGYSTDFASVPRLPLTYLFAGNTAHRSALLHDWLYSQGRMPRELCDLVFLEAMKAEGVSWWRRSLMYRAVRLAGGSRYQEAAP